jgi:hypothetical protein
MHQGGSEATSRCKSFASKFNFKFLIDTPLHIDYIYSYSLYLLDVKASIDLLSSKYSFKAEVGCEESGKFIYHNDNFYNTDNE